MGPIRRTVMTSQHACKKRREHNAAFAACHRLKHFYWQTTPLIIRITIGREIHSP